MKHLSVAQVVRMRSPSIPWDNSDAKDDAPACGGVGELVGYQRTEPVGPRQPLMPDCPNCLVAWDMVLEQRDKARQRADDALEARRRAAEENHARRIRELSARSVGLVLP